MTSSSYAWSAELNRLRAKRQLQQLAHQRAHQQVNKKSSEHFLEPGPWFEESSYDLQRTELAIKTIAYYLPQFHPIAENNQWWGTGFTEWHNVARGRPRFDNHYQPHLPRDLGYYDLRNPDTLRAQAEIARKAGLHAWSFYYYRFGNKRLLEQPIDLFLANKDINISFTLMWANENWTRAWSNQPSENLIENTYRPENDEMIVDDWARHFDDDRYFKIDGKPLLFIYRPSKIPSAAKRVDRWRELLLQRHGYEVLIFHAQVFASKIPEHFGLDGAIEFPPHHLFKASDIVSAAEDSRFEDFAGRAVPYSTLIANSLKRQLPDHPLIRCATPMWDNEARLNAEGLCFPDSSPELFEFWLKQLFTQSARRPVYGERIVAINAWNEWAEGAHLEPDIYYGSAYLNSLARALCST